jgi:hypothetical protein
LNVIAAVAAGMRDIPVIDFRDYGVPLFFKACFGETEKQIDFLPVFKTARRGPRIPHPSEKVTIIEKDSRLIRAVIVENVDSMPEVFGGIGKIHGNPEIFTVQINRRGLMVNGCHAAFENQSGQT